MPYEQIARLMNNAKNCAPGHAQEIHEEAIDPAEKQCGEEGRARRVAHRFARGSVVAQGVAGGRREVKRHQVLGGLLRACHDAETVGAGRHHQVRAFGAPARIVV